MLSHTISYMQKKKKQKKHNYSISRVINFQSKDGHMTHIYYLQTGTSLIVGLLDGLEIFLHDRLVSLPIVLHLLPEKF